MFFLLGDNGGFCYEAFGALVKALNTYEMFQLTCKKYSALGKFKHEVVLVISA